MAELIKIENLIFEYSAVEEESPKRAIDNLSLEVEKGSFTAIIGQNGSGKSTLAKNLNGLLLPTGGAVYVKGWNTQDEAHIWDIRQTAGMVFQNPDNQLVSSIVEDDVAFGPENIGVEPEAIRERVDKALEDVRMGEYKRKAPHHLSGGQKQRIEIARVLSQDPSIIILDEATSALDAKTEQELVSAIHDRGITCIVIAHRLSTVRDCDEIIVLDHGKVVERGTHSELYEKGGLYRDLVVSN